jgi:hypothetical protein
MAIWRGWEFWDDTPFQGGGGPMFQFADDASRIERPIQFRNWQLLPYFVRDMLGDVYSLFGRIYRLTPHHYDLFLTPDGQRPWLYAKAIQRLEGKSPTPGLQFLNAGPFFDMALLRVTYVDLTYEVLEDFDYKMIFVPESGQANPLAGGHDEATLARYVTRIPRPLGHVVSLPRALPRWVLEDGDKGYTVSPQTPGPALFEGVGKVEPGMTLEYIWHMIPRNNIPWTAIRNCMGKLNMFSFDSGLWPKGTLLMEPPEIMPVTSPTGRRTANIKYRFQYVARINNAGEEKGWNYQLRVTPRASGSDILDYRAITMSGLSTGDPTHKFADFAYLFRSEGGP